MNQPIVERIGTLIDVVGALVEQVLKKCTEDEWQDLEDVLNEAVADLRAVATGKTTDTGE